MSGRRAFDPEELRGADGPQPSDAELAEAWAMARELDALASRSDGAGGLLQDPVDSAPREADPAFVDRVMAAIEREPAPRPAAAAGRALREARPVAFLGTLRDAWRVAFGSSRPVGARLGALAYVLAATVVIGSFAGAAVLGTAALLAPAESPVPTPTLPVTDPGATPTPAPTGPALLSPPATAAPATPDGSPDESEDPGASEEPDHTSSPGQASQPTGTDDDHTAEPSASDHSTSSPTSSSSPEASKTPRPSSAPSESPSGTPKPTSSGSGSSQN